MVLLNDMGLGSPAKLHPVEETKQERLGWAAAHEGSSTKQCSYNNSLSNWEIHTPNDKHAYS